MSDEQFQHVPAPFLPGIVGVDRQNYPDGLLGADIESRLEHIVDIPKGKAIYHIAQTDIAKGQGGAGRHGVP